jgi:type IV secretion system protein TrbL
MPMFALQVVVSSPDTTQKIIDLFGVFKEQWLTATMPYARATFMCLAMIELAWSWLSNYRQSKDWESATWGIFWSVLRLGIFFAVLESGPRWIGTIPEGFKIIGRNAAGVAVISPGDIIQRGLDISGELMKTASQYGLLSGEFTVGLMLLWSAVAVFLAFLWIALNYAVTLIEAIILMSVGMFFLAFGASRWTVSWLERLISLAVSIGVKFLLYFCLISAGMSLTTSWIDAAKNIGNDPFAAKTCLSIFGSSLALAVIVWYIPKHFASVLSGSPSLTASDVATLAGTVASTAVSIGAGAAALGAGAAAGAAVIASEAVTAARAGAEIGSISGSSCGTISAPSGNGDKYVTGSGFVSGADASEAVVAREAVTAALSGAESGSISGSEFVSPQSNGTGSTGGGGSRSPRFRPRLPSDGGTHATPPRINLNQD